MGVLAGSLITPGNAKADDSTNAPNLQMTNSTKVIVNSSATARLYFLQENTNLLKDAWAEVAQSRGNGSNLAFSVGNTASQKFYRANAVYEPIEPTAISDRWSTGQTPVYPPQVRNYIVNNYTTNNINVDVTFQESITVGGYTANTPFSQTLVPGTNTVQFIIDLLGHESGTVFTFGTTYITRDE